MLQFKFKLKKYETEQEKKKPSQYKEKNETIIKRQNIFRSLQSQES